MTDSPAFLNKSWDHAEARADIAQAIGGQVGKPFDELAEILGPELTGKAICLGYFGSPDARDDTDYSLGDAFGGYWGVATGGDVGAYVTRVWAGGEVVFEETTPEPTDTLEVGQAHGLNLALDGPA